MTLLILACAISALIIVEGVRHLHKGMTDGWVFILIGVGLLASESVNVILSAYRGTLGPVIHSFLRQFGLAIGLATSALFIVQIARELGENGPGEAATPNKAVERD